MRPEWRLGNHQDPLAEGERGKQVDRAHQHIIRVGTDRDSTPRGNRGQLLEAGAPLLSGLLAVYPLHAHQRRVTLAATGLASRTLDLVAGTQLAAADLRGGDVDVVGVGLQAAQPQEAVPGRDHVEDAAHRLSSGLLLLLLAPPLPGGGPLVLRLFILGLFVLLFIGRGLNFLVCLAIGLLGDRALVLRLLGGRFAVISGHQLRNQLVAAHAAKAGHAQLRGACVQLGEVLRFELGRGHRAARIFTDRRGRRSRREFPAAR